MLLGMRISALQALVAEMPPAVAAQALGYTAERAEDHDAQAGARWSGYVARRSTNAGRIRPAEERAATDR